MHTKKVLTLFWPDGALLTAKKLKMHTPEMCAVYNDLRGNSTRNR